MRELQQCQMQCKKQTDFPKANTAGAFSFAEEEEEEYCVTMLDVPQARGLLDILIRGMMRLNALWPTNGAWVLLYLLVILCLAERAEADIFGCISSAVFIDRLNAQFAALPLDPY